MPMALSQVSAVPSIKTARTAKASHASSPSRPPEPQVAKACIGRVNVRIRHLTAETAAVHAATRPIRIKKPGGGGWSAPARAIAMSTLATAMARSTCRLSRPAAFGIRALT